MSPAQIVFSMICCRTDLWIGVSEAKFDTEVDFEVRLLRVPPKTFQRLLKKILVRTKNLEKRFLKKSTKTFAVRRILNPALFAVRSLVPKLVYGAHAIFPSEL